jgi:ubiquinone/menaquinone biosynthesis C-methylase UbiE
LAVAPWCGKGVDITEVAEILGGSATARPKAAGGRDVAGCRQATETTGDDDSIPHQYWDAVARSYDDLYRSAWSQSENQRVRRVLRTLCPSNGIVLDVGCGTGLGHELLEGLNVAYYGIDPSVAMLNECLLNHPDARLTVGRAADLSTYGDSQFDCVIALFVVMSWEPAITRALAEIERVLKRDGSFYLSFLNRYALRRISRGRVGRNESYGTRGASISDKPLAFTYTRSMLRAYIEAAGLTEVSFTTVSVLAGVAERNNLLTLDAFLSDAVPWLGHTVDAYGRKRCQ